MADLSEIAESLVQRDIVKTEELTKAAINAGIPAEEILNKDIVAGMEVIGEQFEDYYRIPGDNHVLPHSAARLEEGLK